VSPRLGRLALVLVVAGAAILRVWGLDHGLPHPSARPDEREVLEATRTFPAGDLHPRWFIYPSLYLYLVWLAGEAALAARRLWMPTPGYAEVLATSLPTLLLAGRALSAAAGVATVVLTYVLGRRAGGPGAGLLAALLVAVNPLEVRDAHALKPDTALSLALLAGLGAIAWWHARPEPGRALATGAVIGLGMGLKYNAVLLLVPAWASDVARGAGRGLRRWLPSVSLLVVAAAAVAVFVATGPYVLIDFARFRLTFFFSMFAEYATRPEARVPPSAGWLEALGRALETRAFGYHLAVSLRHGCGLAMALATPVALVVALARRTSPLLVLAAGFAPFYWLVIGASPVLLTRYFTPLVPVLALPVAALVAAAAARLPRGAARVVFAAVATVALAAEPLALSVAHVRLAARTDTRVEALGWMARHLPADAVVAVLGGGLFRYADPVLPAGVRAVPPGTPVADYPRLGVTHVVVHDHRLGFSRPRPADLDALAPHLALLAEFDPYPRGPAGVFEAHDAFYIPLYGYAGVERPGPRVRIYAYTP
jgi:4-amino-4-deoxy-L-arabinose transferase-like glycosyltransferase